MFSFTITVSNNEKRSTYVAIAPSSLDAYFSAAEAQGDTPCSISVIPFGVAQ